MEEAIKNMVWISTEEYKELIEAKCKAEAEVNSQRSNWYRANIRADEAETKYKELQEEDKKRCKWMAIATKYLVEKGLYEECFDLKGGEPDGRD